MMLRWITGVVIALGLAGAGIATLARGASIQAVATYRVTKIDTPIGATDSEAHAINNKGQIAGWLKTQDGRFHGFVLSGGHFKTIDVTSTSQGTMIYGLNDAGDVCGAYWEPGKSPQSFLMSGAKISTLSPPREYADELIVGGITDNDLMIGDFVGLPVATGVVIDGGAYHSINPAPPGGLEDSGVAGINAAGDVVGTYAVSSGAMHGFEQCKGKITYIDKPGASQTELYAINDLGQIVCKATKIDRNGYPRSVWYLLSGGNFQPIDPPGAVWSALVATSNYNIMSINDNGQIVGDSFDEHGLSSSFLLDPIKR